MSSWGAQDVDLEMTLENLGQVSIWQLICSHENNSKGVKSYDLVGQLIDLLANPATSILKYFLTGVA